MTLIRWIGTAAGFVVSFSLIQQCRKPRGWLGRRLARAMNLGHAGLTRWGLTHVTVRPHSRILDIGCGGGQTIATLAANAAEGHVDGVDYSAASVAVARERNAALIAAGRVDIRQASMSALPFAESSFDLVTAVETHYYWPNLPADFREVLRVLAPGGQFIIIAETYRGRSLDFVYAPVMRGLLRARYLSLAEHRAALVEAGFVDVQVDTDAKRAWMYARGTKPEVRVPSSD